MHILGNNKQLPTGKIIEKIEILNFFIEMFSTYIFFSNKSIINDIPKC